jgi:hypothetical protein
MGLRHSTKDSNQREPDPRGDEGSCPGGFESLQSKTGASEFRAEQNKVRIKDAAKIILALPAYEKFSLNELLVLCLPKMPANTKTSLSKTISSLLNNDYLRTDEKGYISINTERLSEISWKAEQTSDYREVKLNGGTKRLITPLRELVLILDPNAIPSIHGLAVKFELSSRSKNLNSETIEAALRDLIKAGWLINTGNNTVCRSKKIPSVDEARPLSS